MDTKNKLQESPKETPKLQKLKAKKENPETQVMTEALKDITALDEASVGTTGKVSEMLSEQKDGDLGGSNQKNDDEDEEEKAKKRKAAYLARKAKLLQSAPAPKIMAKQVKKEIQKEINYLHKKMIKMAFIPGEVNYAEMTNTVKKMRELKGTLKLIFKTSVEGLKTMWLRFVHGIM